MRNSPCSAIGVGKVAVRIEYCVLIAGRYRHDVSDLPASDHLIGKSAGLAEELGNSVLPTPRNWHVSLRYVTFTFDLYDLSINFCSGRVTYAGGVINPAIGSIPEGRMVFGKSARLIAQAETVCVTSLCFCVLVVIGVQLARAAEDGLIESTEAREDIAPSTDPGIAFWRAARPVYAEKGPQGET